jgi:hypothetical protein
MSQKYTLFILYQFQALVAVEWEFAVCRDEGNAIGQRMTDYQMV